MHVKRMKLKWVPNANYLIKFVNYEKTFAYFHNHPPFYVGYDCLKVISQLLSSFAAYAYEIIT